MIGVKKGIFSKRKLPIFQFNLINSTLIVGQINTSSPIVFSWGDGTTSIYNGSSIPISHNYSSLGSYTVKIYSNDINALTRFEIEQGNIAFDLSHLPQSIKALSITSSNYITGNISDLPNNILSIICFGSNTISGNISNFKSTLTYIHIEGLNTLSGNLINISTLPLTDFLISGNNTITGNIEYLPASINTLYLAGNNTVSGNINTLMCNPQFFNISGNNTISGNIIDLPTNCILFYLEGNNTISGNIKDIPNLINKFIVDGLNTIFGDVGLTINSFQILIIKGNANLNSYTSKIWNNNISNIQLKGSLSSTNIDNILIDLSNSIFTDTKLINLALGTNAARTSASNAAVISLQAQGVSVTTF